MKHSDEDFTKKSLNVVPDRIFFKILEKFCFLLDDGISTFKYVLTSFSSSLGKSTLAVLVLKYELTSFSSSFGKSTVTVLVLTRSANLILAVASGRVMPEIKN